MAASNGGAFPAGSIRSFNSTVQRLAEAVDGASRDEGGAATLPITAEQLDEASAALLKICSQLDQTTGQGKYETQAADADTDPPTVACDQGRGWKRFEQAGLANLRAHFLAYDVSDNGYLSPIEIERLLTSIGLGPHTRKWIQSALKEADASADASVCLEDGVSFDEFAEWMNATIDEHYNEEKEMMLPPDDIEKIALMQQSVRKVGFAGTSWRKFQDTIWILTEAVVIMCASTMFVGVVWFRFILVPMTMAYFMTFLFGPLIDVMAQRPLICFGRVFCKINKLPPDRAGAIWKQRYGGRRRLPPVDHLEYPYDTDGQVCCHARPPTQDTLAGAVATTFHQWLTVGKLPFPLALVLTLIFTAVAVHLAVLLVSRDIQLVLADAKFMDEFEGLLISVVERLKNEMGVVITEFDPAEIRRQLEGNKTCSDDNELDADILQVQVPSGNGTECIQVQEFSSEQFSELVGPYLVVANDLVLTFLLCLYLLAARTMRGEFDHNRALHAAGHLTVVEKIEMMNRNYVQLKTKLSALTAICVMVILFVCSVKLWFIWGLLTFILNFIPNVGSLIAMVLPVPVILVDQQLGVVRQATAILLPAVVQAYVGNVLEPQVFGKSLNLTAISVLIGLVFWSAIWGMAGAMLSVPLLGVMKILLDEADYPLAKRMLALIREDSTLNEEEMARTLIKELSGYQQEHAYSISTSEGEYDNPSYTTAEATSEV